MSHFSDQSRGNYRNYYLRRRANHTDLAPDRDERLDLLSTDESGDDVFKNKVVLDVGCNSGAVSTEIAQLHHARQVIGVDIDLDLIQSCSQTVQQTYSVQKPLLGKLVATAELEKRKKRRKLTSDQVEADPSNEAVTRYFPACFPALYDVIPINPRPESSTSSSGTGTSTSTGTDRKRKCTSLVSDDVLAFPQNLVFYAADWAEEEIETDATQYDVILALSLTKWIHLHGLDEGLMRFFQKCFDCLKPDGKLILEKQGWRGYKDAKRSSQTLKDNYFKLKLRPEEDFERILLQKVGFKRREGVKDGSSSGFDRSLEIYYK